MISAHCGDRHGGQERRHEPGGEAGPVASEGREELGQDVVGVHAQEVEEVG